MAQIGILEKKYQQICKEEMKFSSLFGIHKQASELVLLK